MRQMMQFWKPQVMWHSADVFNGSGSSVEMFLSDYKVTYVAAQN